MAALNFPDPNVTTSYTNPDTGITYEWANGVWKSVSSALTAPELFVDVDGDNLTGNLTLGTDKIVLNATDGSATFAAGDVVISGSGNVKSGDPDNSAGSVLSPVGQNYARQDGAGSSVAAYLVQNGGTTAADTVARINYDGSATFAGDVSLGQNLTGGYALKINAEGNSGNVGGIYLTTNPSSSAQAALLVRDLATNTDNVQISTDGSATFAGNLFVGDDCSISGFNGSANFAGSDIQLLADGSATFAGAITTTATNNAFYASAGYSGGEAAIRVQNTNAGGNPYYLYCDSSDGKIAYIKTDGGASFDGETIVKGDLLKRTAAGSTVVALRDDYLRVYDSPVSYDDYTISLEKDGSATFAGPITLGTWANTSDSAIYMANQADSGQIIVKGNGSSSQSAFSVYSGGWSGSSNQTAAIKGDGSVWFARGNFQMDTAGIIQTNLYSAGTLNIDSSGSFGNPKIVLNASNGSATFAGYGQFGSSTYTYRGILALNNDNGGTIYARNHKSGGAVYEGANGSDVTTSRIYENGNASLAGYLLLGTSVSTSNSDRLLQVGDTSRSATYIECRTSDTGSGGVLFSDGTNGTNTGYRGSIEYLHSPDFLSFKVASNDRMSINGSGQFFVGGVYSYTSSNAANVHVFPDGLIVRSTSSIKYKTDVETLEDSYANNILNCRPVWYRSSSSLDNKDWGYWGFIAEEVAEIDPRLVNWKTTEISHDENGAKVETPCDPEPEGVQYDRFVPHLLNLIKRQKAQIEDLEARLSTLEAS